MKAADLVDVSVAMLNEGISNTYEYPGYINVWYRSIDVTIRIDDTEMVFQLSYNGIEVPNTTTEIIDISNVSTTSDVLPHIKKALCHCYQVVDEYLLVNGH